MRINKMVFYSDAGRGWLKVPVAELRKRNLMDKISEYSYRKGDYAYLEEDCDIVELFDSFLSDGIPVEEIKAAIKSAKPVTNSRIRNYARFYK